MSYRSSRGAAQRAAGNISVQMDQETSSEEETEPPAKKGKRRLSLKQASMSKPDQKRPAPPVSRPSASRKTASQAAAVSFEDSDIEILDDDAASFPPSTQLSTSSAADNNDTIPEFGKYVFVLVNTGLSKVYHPRDLVSGADEFLWWPAKVISRSRSLISLKLYEAPHSSLSCNPCRENIQSFSTRSEPLFWRGTDSAISSDSSPRKRVKYDYTELNATWFKACRHLLADKEEEEDSDLPDPDFAFTGSALDRPRKHAEMSEDDADFGDLFIDAKTVKEWIEPEPDDSLQIPGELVLAREKPSANTDYWPAKLLEFKTREGFSKGKYLVEYLDTTTKQIPREWFFAPDNEGFASCKMGKAYSDYIVDTIDEEDLVIRSRSASPVPIEPPPSSEDFSNLSPHEQLAYVKPVLRAILNGRYSPVLPRHERFMRGGQSRDGLWKDAAPKGLMAPREADEISAHLKYWCLRDLAALVEPQIEENKQRSSESSIQSTAEEVPPNIEAISLTVPPTLSGKNNALKPTLFIDTDTITTIATTTPVIISEVISDSRPPLSAGFASPLTALSESESTFEVPPASSQVLSQAPYVQPPPQAGCDEYEHLSVREKSSYCLDILLPVAIGQILLWRKGRRKSVALLSADQEQEMYDEAETLRREVDWVFEVYQLRKTMEDMAKRPKRRRALEW